MLCVCGGGVQVFLVIWGSSSDLWVPVFSSSSNSVSCLCFLSCHVIQNYSLLLNPFWIKILSQLLRVQAIVMIDVDPINAHIPRTLFNKLVLICAQYRICSIRLLNGPRSLLWCPASSPALPPIISSFTSHFRHTKLPSVPLLWPLLSLL